MALSKEQKAAIIAKYGENEKDTGSTKVQIALLTEQINALTAHLKENKHDYSSKRGLFLMIGKRKSLLSYLKNTDVVKYREVIKKLNIRK